MLLKKKVFYSYIEASLFAESLNYGECRAIDCHSCGWIVEYILASK